MRYLIAIFAGAWIAAVPLVLLVVPDVAERYACYRSVESDLAGDVVVGNVAAGLEAPIEDPCPMIDEVLPHWAISLLATVVLLSACFLGGRVAAHISEHGGVVVGPIAGALPYALMMLFESEPAAAVVVAVAALTAALGAKRRRIRVIPG